MTCSVNTTEKPALPELYQTQMNVEGLQALFTDIKHCTRVVEVMVKHHPQAYVPEGTVSFEAAREMLLAGDVRGLQVRYVYEGQYWWDTILRRGEGFFVTRIAAA